MAKGGARSRSGPAPDPMAQARERDADGWVVLPASCDLEPPPLSLPRPLQRERKVWADLWTRPQATMWHRLGQADMVAIYVRRLVECEQRDATASLVNATRQLADGLGLTIAGLRTNRWVIEGSADAAAITSSQGARQDRAQARQRFRVVDGGG